MKRKRSSRSDTRALLLLLAVLVALPVLLIVWQERTVVPLSGPAISPAPTISGRQFDDRLELHLRYLQMQPTGRLLVQYLRASDLTVEWAVGETAGEADVGLIRLDPEQLMDPRAQAELLDDVIQGRRDWRHHVGPLEFVAAQAIIAHELTHQVMGDPAVARTPDDPLRLLAEQRAHLVELKVVCEQYALLKGEPVDYGYAPAWEVYGELLPPDRTMQAMLTGASPADMQVAEALLWLPGQ